MTKVYLVRSVRLYEDANVSNHVEGVFTNKKLAENYAKWIKKILLKSFRDKPKHMEIYIDTREICRIDYSELPY